MSLIASFGVRRTLTPLNKSGVPLMDRGSRGLGEKLDVKLANLRHCVK